MRAPDFWKLSDSPSSKLHVALSLHRFKIPNYGVSGVSILRIAIMTFDNSYWNTWNVRVWHRYIYIYTPTHTFTATLHGAFGHHGFKETTSSDRSSRVLQDLRRNSPFGKGPCRQRSNHDHRAQSHDLATP